MRRLLPSVIALLLLPAAAASAATMLSDDQARAVCGESRAGESCSAGNGRTTAGGNGKVSHAGWPAITGIFWMVKGDHDAEQTGSDLADELLGHHGSDRIDGGAGRDVIWGDWDPEDNTTRQRDVLIGGAGADRIYPSHGTTTVRAGAGNDDVWAYYGKGVIDCGPGNDIARVRWQRKAFKLRNCERVRHFCAFGSKPDGDCYKPGEKPRR